MARYIFYLINILFCICLQAQSSGELFDHDQAIINLRKTHLLVRLESKDHKIKFLQKELEKKNCDEKCRSSIEEQIQDIIASRDTFNIQFIRSFKQYFKFCPVYFYYDKDHEQLLQSEFNGSHFLDATLAYISVRSKSKDSILILKKDITPNSENEGWLFQTVDGKTFRHGFPFISQNNFTTMMNRIAYSNHIMQNCNYMVKKLNKKLFSYLHDVKAKQMDARNSFEEE